MGATVNAGDPICVLGAMKMEMVVTAPITGSVQQIAVHAGDSISAGDLVVKLVQA